MVLAKQLRLPGVELAHETQDPTCKNKKFQLLAHPTILWQNIKNVVPGGGGRAGS
jgi:hypothetical protein